MAHKPSPCELQHSYWWVFMKDISGFHSENTLSLVNKQPKEQHLVVPEKDTVFYVKKKKKKKP